MKLIDADELLEIHNLETKIIGKDWAIDDLATAIELAPTIPAIPIEWLQKKADETAALGSLDNDLHEAILLVYKAWEYEQKEY